MNHLLLVCLGLVCAQVRRMGAFCGDICGRRATERLENGVLAVVRVVVLDSRVEVAVTRRGGHGDGVVSLTAAGCRGGGCGL